MSSWPALFAAALATWLVLKGPASTNPVWVRRVCRVAMAFFLYSGFLYLLKWNPFWKLLSVDVENRNKLEGFLILLSTLIWLVATLRTCFWVPDSPPLMPIPANVRITYRERKSFGLSLKRWRYTTTFSRASNSTVRR